MPDNVAATVPRSRTSLFLPLRLIAVFTLVAPAVVFSYATWQNHRDISERANERIVRELDVLQEHALKALQTVERAISETNEVLRGLSDEEIRRQESELYLRLKRTQQALPQIESIWAFDGAGRPLVSSTTLPVPADMNVQDRSYFQAHKDITSGTFVSEVITSRIGTLRFIAVSGRRTGEAQDRFNGVIAVTVMPEHFSEFYRKLADGRDYFALVKSDGTYLSRFPELVLEGRKVSAPFHAAISAEPDGGMYAALSEVDRIERRIGFRRVPGFDVYALAGVETGSLTDEFVRTVATQFAIGAPAVFGMFALSLYALRRAQRFQEEVGKREAAEVALKQAQRLEAIGQLTGGVAHDFNNLLMVVSGNLERLKRHVTAEDRPRRAIEAIENAVHRGSDLTRQLLSFSRRQTHAAEAIDLHQRLPAISEMLQSSLRGDISVTTTVAKGVWPIKADVSELELALLNLAVNARDAMPKGGQIAIAARNVNFGEGSTTGLTGEFVAISVRDTGEGIAPEILARVFEPFFTTKEVGRGTGLGLSQVYGFAQQAGGTATLDSEPGRGTTVTLYLPRSAAEAARRKTANASENAPRGARIRGQVLLVEDNADVAEVTRGLLEDAGYSVLGAFDVRSALAILGRRERIDAVLSDIVMPGGASGLDLARKVREDFGAALPVILATGYSDKAQAAADEGFILLRKPYNQADLRKALASGRKKGVA